MVAPLQDSAESLATPVAWTDAAGRVVGGNPAFASWLGVSLRRLAGLSLADLDAETDRLSELLPRLPDTGEALRVRRARLAFPGGTERFAELWLARLDDGGVRIEVHPADEFPGEDPATLLPAALSAALKGLAHEIRNPLAGMKGAAQLLGRRVDTDDARELVGLIDAEVDRLAALVDRLMNPAPPHDFHPTNIHAVLERVRQLAEVEAGWAIKIVRDFDPSLPEFPGDADRLTQALWNLVRNALESGASQVQLRTRAEHHLLIGDAAHRLVVRVEIADDGRGVPDDLAERIFLPLVSGRAEGSGLGLPLAQQVAREHRGSLSYRSRPGHTVFTLLIPVPDDEP
ncbi:MAG: PAS domain-containing protein [Arenimonas sp.]|uniref:two-component system sensor histidine kinase NtrB n=1 Tax=Arenimonas sp. TaxID=1872635 RepID=UPI0025C47807|nr:ATP-binding protein [Arenimonas sp.]MBW8368497.1 PAS domain-containing protein [Arenimonas sp.]